MIAQTRANRWSELLTGFLVLRVSNLAQNGSVRICHGGAVEDAGHEQFFSCSSACSICLHRRFTGKVRWPERCGFRGAKDVPILRLDHAAVQGTLLGMWEATVMDLGSDVQLGQ